MQGNFIHIQAAVVIFRGYEIDYLFFIGVFWNLGHEIRGLHTDFPKSFL